MPYVCFYSVKEAVTPIAKGEADGEMVTLKDMAQPVEPPTGPLPPPATNKNIAERLNTDLHECPPLPPLAPKVERPGVRVDSQRRAK